MLMITPIGLVMLSSSPARARRPRSPGSATVPATADDVAEEELQAFARDHRSAVLLQASATVVGVFLPLTAVVFYLAVSVFFIINPLRHMGVRVRHPAG